MRILEIKRDWNGINRPKINRFLSARFYGRWPRIMIFATAFVVLFLCMLVIKLYLPHQYQPRNWVTALAPIYLAFVTAVMLNARWKNKLRHALNDAPIRRNCETVYLSEHGVSDFGPPKSGAMTWAYITDVLEFDDMVLLLLSPIEYIPLPDSGLPAGLTRAALLDQIANWRKAAA